MAQPKTAPQPEAQEIKDESPEIQVETSGIAEVEAILKDNPLVWSMLEVYLKHRLEIVEFNERVLASEKQAAENVWTQTRLLKEVSKVAHPEDASVKPDPQAVKLYNAYEKALDAVNKARDEASKYMANKLGVEMTYEKPKPDETEVKRIQTEVRLPAVEVGKNLSAIGSFAGAEVKAAIDRVLSEHPLPQVGRKGSLDLTETTSTKPKYRVDVTAVRNGQIVFTGEEGKGFTKASMSAKKLHAKDESPTPEDFRKAWEAAGKKNTEFEHKGIVYRLAARN